MLDLRREKELYRFELDKSEAAVVVDWRPMVSELLEDMKSGVSVGAMSARFHNTMAEVIVALARLMNEKKVVLSGGCFQNKYLTEQTNARLNKAGFQPYWHQRIPPNDGGIALGQAVAATYFKNMKD